MNKKILKVRSPFRALLYSIFAGSTDDFTQQALKGNAKKGLFNKLTTKYRFLMTVLKTILSIGIVGGAFAWMGILCMGKINLSLRELLPCINILVFIFTWLFCFMPSMSALFMSHDVLFFMTLPIKESSLVRAKLLQVVWLNSYSDLGMLCFFLGGAITGHYGLSFIITGSIFVVTSCIFSKIIMFFLLFCILNKTKKIANKDRLIKYFGCIMMIMCMLLSLGSNLFGSMTQVMITNYTNFLHSLPGLIITNTLNIFTISGFFIPLFVLPQELYRYFFLLALVLTLVVAIYFISKYMSARYLIILRNLQNHSNSNASQKSILQQSRKPQFTARSPRNSFAYTDKLLVKRTPNLFTHFVLSPIIENFLLVAIICAQIGFALKNANIHTLLEQIREYISSNASLNWPTTYFVFVIMAAITFVLLFSAFASSTSSEIIRDGCNFIFYRTLPLKMKDYLIVKLKRTFIYTYAIYEMVVIILLALAVNFVELPIMTAALLIVYSLSLEICLCVSELIVGTIFASFNFDLETELLQQLKSFSRMLLNIVACLVIVLPLLAVCYISQGFSFQIADMHQITYSPIIVTAWQLLLALVLLAVYLGPFAKRLGTKSLT